MIAGRATSKEVKAEAEAREALAESKGVELTALRAALTFGAR